jgi:hypothetical protein
MIRCTRNKKFLADTTGSITPPATLFLRAVATQN